MLTAHEIATLLLLLNAPVEVMAATPDVGALQEVGLVQLVESEQGEAHVRPYSGRKCCFARAGRRMILIQSET
ncbi:hypothetical protein [Paraburkholderia kirstenboschensis]|uniref:hypothetical protein n=1 Tax=Paraburkholderia kirstenboschensis TaxID=1245436 RepID=UPI003742919D